MKTWGPQYASQNRKSIPSSLLLRNPPLATWTADPDCLESPLPWELLVLMTVGHFLTFMQSRSGRTLLYSKVGTFLRAAWRPLVWDAEDAPATPCCPLEVSPVVFPRAPGGAGSSAASTVPRLFSWLGAEPGWESLRRSERELSRRGGLGLPRSPEGTAAAQAPRLWGNTFLPVPGQGQGTRRGDGGGFPQVSWDPDANSEALLPQP